MKSSLSLSTDTVDWGRWRIAWLNAENILAINDLLHSGSIDGVGLSRHHGFEGTNLSLLKSLHKFDGVVISTPDGVDCSELLEFSRLKFLSFGPGRTPIAFTEFPNLVDLRINWDKMDNLPGDESLLESFYLKGFTPKAKNLTSLSTYSRLGSLELVQAGIESLLGVEKQVALKEMQISHSPKLHSIASLAMSSVELVHIESCKNIEDIKMLSGCRHLKTLRLADCGKLDSLAFLRSFPALEEFRFVNTTVEDGDMTPLLHLERVGFLAKRGYSHTPDEVRAHIAARTPETSPETLSN